MPVLAAEHKLVLMSVRREDSHKLWSAPKQRVKWVGKSESA